MIRDKRCLCSFATQHRVVAAKRRESGWVGSKISTLPLAGGPTPFPHRTVWLVDLRGWGRGHWSFDQIGFQQEFLIRGQGHFRLKRLISGKTDLEVMFTGDD